MAELRISRRTLLKTGLAAAALGTAGLKLAGDAAAVLPNSQYLDLSQPSYDLFARNRPLHESHHVMQGLTIDNVNNRIYIAQAKNVGSGDDLCINQLDFTGKVTGYMYLDNAGHGVSIAAEPVGSSTYIWAEANSSANDDTGRGTALQRFKFVSGAAPSGVKKYLTGSTDITAATDPINQRIMIRRSIGGHMHFDVFTQAAATAGDFSAPLASIAMPSGITGTFQGYGFYGRYLYVLTGDGHADSADIDSKISCIDLNTGSVVEPNVLTKAGSTLVYREPEGMAVYQTSSGDVRLVFGFGSRDSVDGIERYANLFYKDALIG